jgi:nucleoside-diphosphate-sugar epimerase
VNVLVTGASGFLGRHVVAELVRRGHGVRALLREGSSIDPCPGGVEVVRGDLRSPAALVGIAGDAEGVLHLAAPVAGDPEDAFTTAVVGTEHLLAALKDSPVERMVLASSVAVYDWSAADGTITEATPLVADPWPRGGYTVAKLWQEHVSRVAADEQGIALTILRPGFLWGRGHEALAGIGPSLGRIHLVVSGRRRLPATYVENCAHCFVSVLEDRRAAGRVYNVVDDPGPSAWRYMGSYLRAKRSAGVRVPVPYAAARGAALLAGTAARRVFEHGGRLPSLLDPPRMEARLKPVRCTSTRLERELGWHAPIGLEEALSRTYDTKAGAPC